MIEEIDQNQKNKEANKDERKQNKAKDRDSYLKKVEKDTANLQKQIIYMIGIAVTTSVAIFFLMNLFNPYSWWWLYLKVFPN